MKVVFIIGASDGVGLEVANLLVNENYIVINGSRTVCPNEKVISLSVDVVNIDTICSAIKFIINKYNRIDVLIYSAGFSMAGPVENVLDIDYRYLFEVNFFGFIETTRRVIPIMKKQNDGKIICISSLGGSTPIPYDSFYSASKAALDIFWLDLKLELERFNIFITCIVPGGIKTNFTYKRKTYITNNDYLDMKNAIKTLAMVEQKGMDVKKVAMYICNVIMINRPPLIKVTGITNKFKYHLSRIMPKKILLKYIKYKFKLNKK